MSKVTNLNRFRKARTRDRKRAEAEENAVTFGRSKAQKALDKARAEQAQRTLDGHRRDRAENAVEDRAENGAEEE